LFGDDHEVLCAEKSYADPSELFQDAVRLNMSHGLPIRKEDYKLIAAKGERLGVSHSGVQGLLNVSGDSATWLLRAAVPKPKPASAVAPAFSERGFNNGWRNRAQGLPSPPPKPKCLDCDRPAMDDAVRCVECMAKLSHRTASRSGLLYSGDDFEEHATESLVPIDDDKLDDIRFDNSAQERLAVLRAAKSSESELAFYAEKVRRVIDMRMNSGQRFSESETEELSELRSALLRMFTAA
jgi:hypothetical protein